MDLPFAVFAQLFTAMWFNGSKDKALEELPSAEDIPHNAATSGICSLIEKVRKLV